MKDRHAFHGREDFRTNLRHRRGKEIPGNLYENPIGASDLHPGHPQARDGVTPCLAQIDSTDLP